MTITVQIETMTEAGDLNEKDIAGMLTYIAAQLDRSTPICCGMFVKVRGVPFADVAVVRIGDVMVQAAPSQFK
jgi:hypothetical protein